MPKLPPATVVTANVIAFKARMVLASPSAMNKVGEAALGLVFPTMPYTAGEKEALVPVPSAQPYTVPEAPPPATVETAPPAETARMRADSATNREPA